MAKKWIESAFKKYAKSSSFFSFSRDRFHIRVIALIEGSSDFWKVHYVLSGPFSPRHKSTQLVSSEERGEKIDLVKNRCKIGFYVLPSTVTCNFFNWEKKTVTNKIW